MPELLEEMFNDESFLTNQIDAQNVFLKWAADAFVGTVFT